MKKKIRPCWGWLKWIGPFFLGTAGACGADYAATVLSDAPLGYYRLGELPVTSDDIIVNRGTLAAAANGVACAATHPVPGLPGGNLGTAALFTAAAATPPAGATRVVMGSPASFNFTGTASFTLEAWVQPTTLSGTMRVISNGQAGQGYAFGFSGNNMLLITGLGVADVRSDAAPVAFALGQWLHIAVVRDGTAVRFYTNGVQLGTAKTLSNIKTTANPLTLGRTAALAEPFNGAIDEAAVYDKALPGDALAAHYLAATTPGQDYAAAVLANAPIGYWPLNEPAKPESPTVIANSGSVGTAGHGRAVGMLGSVVGGVTGAVSGDPDTAMLFNGHDGRIEVPYNPDLNPTGPWSIECWARLEGWTNLHQAALSSRNDGATGSRGFIFYAAPVSNNPQWQFWTGGGLGVGWQTMAGPALDTNEVTRWYHLIGTYDPVTRAKAFYVDGQRVGAAAGAIVAVNELRPIRIGGGANESPTGNYYWDGSIDEVAIYPSVLSQERVVAHYAAGQGAAPNVVNPPVATFNPVASQTVHSDQRILIGAGFSGSLPLTFQWYKISTDGLTTNAVPGATSEVLEIPKTSPADSGQYFCEATNPLGTAQTAVGVLEVLAPEVPSIVEDVAANVPVYVGGTASLEALFGGTPPFTYQWLSNGVAIADATNAVLRVAGVQSDWAATEYVVRASNAYGSTPSSVSHLDVLVPRANTYAAVITELKPLAWWRLGESIGSIAFDVWGGYNGRYDNSFPDSLPGALFDDDDGALTLAGATSRMVVSNSAPFSFSGTNAFTLVTWARPDVFSGVQRLISNRSASPNGGYGFGFRNQNQVRLTAFGVVDVDASVVAFTEGTWYHIAAVRYSNRMDLYIDGELKGSGAVNDIVGVPTPLQIGGNPTATEYFTGAVDEPAIFDRPLEASEIARLYQARYGSKLPPTIVQGPAANILYEGGTTHFTVNATGSEPLGYQWKSNGVAIPNATNATLALPNVTTAMSGASYSVTVANMAGTATSAGASLTVLPGYGYQAAIAADHPVGLWRLNEVAGPTLYDTFGGHNGFETNALLFAQPGALAGDTDTATTFDGVSAFVQVPHSLDLNPPQFSVECWARVTGGAGLYRAAVSSRDYQAGYIIYAGSANTWQFWTRAPGYAWLPLVGTPVVLNEWTHLVATYDGTTKRFYIDGTLAAEEVNLGYAPNLLRPLRIGAGNNEDDPGAGSVYPFMGDIDEVAVYPGALTAAQVATHYGLGKYGNNTAPFFIRQPKPETVLAGNSVTFTVQPAGSPPLALQWQKDGVDIPGATGATLTLDAPDYTDAGAYRAVVRNGVGEAFSEPAALGVMPFPSYCLLTEDLVLHLGFDGNLQDTSGRANHALPEGDPTFVTGRIGTQALRFVTDSTNNIYRYATLAQFPGQTPADFRFGAATDFSVAFWLNYSASPGDPVFVGDANWDGGSKGWLISPTYGTDGLALWISDGTRSLNYNGPAGAIGGNAWHHVVATFQRAGNVRLYLDGAPVYQAPLAAIGDIDNNDLGYVLNIGQDGTGYYFPYIPDGTIDDLGIWRRALSEYDAQSIYLVGRDAGRTFDQAGPVTVDIRAADGFVDVIWQGGTLQQAASVTGPFAPVAGAKAPFYRTTPGASATFFRVK